MLQPQKSHCLPHNLSAGLSDYTCNKHYEGSKDGLHAFQSDYLVQV